MAVRRRAGCDHSNEVTGLLLALPNASEATAQTALRPFSAKSCQSAELSLDSPV